MKRTRLRPKQRPAEEIAERARVRADVFARDGHRCLLAARRDVPACSGTLTPHHLRKSGQGGSYTLRNLVSLCSFHNDSWVESHPDAAWALGLVCRNGDTLLECWDRLRAAGLVRTAW